MTVHRTLNRAKPFTPQGEEEKEEGKNMNKKRTKTCTLTRKNTKNARALAYMKKK
jgi:hypothetical protein